MIVFIAIHEQVLTMKLVFYELHYLCALHLKVRLKLWIQSVEIALIALGHLIETLVALLACIIILIRNSLSLVRQVY
jgi:hypothetical protein